MSGEDRKLATIYVSSPVEDGGWTVSIEPCDQRADGAWFEFPTAAEAFERAVKWLTDRGLRWDCRFEVYPPAARLLEQGDPDA